MGESLEAMRLQYKGPTYTASSRASLWLRAHRLLPAHLPEAGGGMTCMSGVPLSIEEVDAALKESRGSSGPPLTDLGGVSEGELLRVRATVEKVNRLSDHVADLKAIIAKNHNRDLELMKQRDEALRAYIDAANVAGLVRRAADNPRASGKRDGFTRPTEGEWREIVRAARATVGGGK